VTGALDTTQVDWDSCELSRRSMITAWRSGIPGTWVPLVHRTCPHNELEALCARVLGPLPPGVFAPLAGGPSRVFRRLRSIAGRYGGHKWSLLETALSYKGAMRVKYLKVVESLRDRPVGHADARLSCFLKAEKTNPLAKFQKPRLIFPRDGRYNLEVASRLKPFEHWLWGYLTGRRIWGGSNTRVVAKGLSPGQRARLIVKKFNSFRDCVVFEVDGKAFEAHVGPDHLVQEHSVYGAAYPLDKGLATLLSEQLRLKGRLPCGAKFDRPGGRASGDFNTGMGNTLLMLAIAAGVMNRYSVTYDMLVDGDNALIFLERPTSGMVVANLAADVLASSGHEFTLERPVHILEGVRFGRSAVVHLGRKLGYTMVRDPYSVMSGACSSHRYLREPKFAREYLAGVSMCELSMARGVPVLQAWASTILASTKFTGKVRETPFADYLVQGAWFAGVNDEVEVSRVARESFERAFGITPEAQIRLEESFVGPSFPLDLSCRVDSRDLLNLPAHVMESYMDSTC